MLSKAKDKYPDFEYIDILNSQLQSFQLKFTERLENRLSSKTIKVLLSYRKLTGRKRIAFDSNMHQIVIFSYELENVKQLNFRLQKLESDNIEFEKRCSDLHNSLPEEICLKGVLEKFNVSESAYRELTAFCDGLPRTYLVSSMPGRY